MPLLEENGFSVYHTKPLAIDDELDVLAGITDLAISSDKIEKVIKKGTGKASISYFPSEDIGLLAKSDTGDETFKIVIGGVDVGDVIMGDYAGGAGAKWDESMEIFDIKGTIAASTIDIGGSDASSFHVDIDGNMWLGAATFASSSSKISNAGAATFTNVTASNVGAAFFGDGSDGDVTISANTTLTRDMYYNNLTVANGYTLSPAGYRIFVKGTLTTVGTGKVSAVGNAGGNASGVTGGSAGAASHGAGTFVASVASGAGGNEATAGGNGINTTKSIGVSGVAGTNGGKDGTGNVGGVGGTAGVASGTILNTIKNPMAIYNLYDYVGGISQFDFSASSGGSGGGNSVPPVDPAKGRGGGGGGAGSPGGCLVIFARYIVNGGSITVQGGNGGNAANGTDGTQYGGGGGSGGSSGSGGVCLLVYNTFSGNAPIYSAGTPGAKGLKGHFTVAGTNGEDGVDGNSGNTGILITITNL